MIRTIMNIGPARPRRCRIVAAKRAALPGYPWFPCVTNRVRANRWMDNSPTFGFNVTHIETGRTPGNVIAGTRDQSVIRAVQRLDTISRAAILGAVARVKAGYGLTRFPTKFKYRSL